jgi:polysaccharide deacetylase family protein (PEP-CTERM system associated)
MSIDVEDWFQVENLQRGISRETWNGRELRVERNLQTVLDLLAEGRSRGTFFILGWIAERVPRTVRMIHEAGHEVASHGYGHELVYRLTRERFIADIERSKKTLEDLIGAPVLGYRAPNFSITEWAIDVLQECGFRYDSSFFPAVTHDRYGKLESVTGRERGIVEVRPGFYQVILSCLSVFGRNLPWAGGGYFRLLPYGVFRRGIRSILRAQGSYCFYIHPWEFDPDQPRVQGIDAWYSFRHYNNLEKTRGRYVRLLREFQFTAIRDALS